MPQRIGRPSRAPHEGHALPDEAQSHAVGHLVRSNSAPCRRLDPLFMTVLRACDDLPRHKGWKDGDVPGTPLHSRQHLRRAGQTPATRSGRSARVAMGRT